MYYLVTIGYEQETEKGSTKVQKLKYVINAASVEEATIVATKYRAGDTRDSESLSVAKMGIECVIHPDITPEFYK